MNLSRPVLSLWLVGALGAAQAPVPSAALLSDQGGGLAPIAPVSVEFSQLKVRYRPPVPSYPPLARIAKVQGTVKLRLTIGTNGRVEKVDALGGPKLLGLAAVAFFREWTFDPVKVEGAPSRVQSEVQMPFRLKDVPDFGGDDQLSQAVVQIEAVPSPVSVPIDSGAVQKEVEAWLTQAGLVPTSQAGADPGKAIHLKLKIQTIQTRDGLYIQNVMERVSLLPDRALEENKPGEPQRIWFFNRVLGQKGESGFQDSLLGTVRSALHELVALPSVPGPPLRSEKVAPLGNNPPGQLAPDKPLVVDFQFSQVKVKHQPAAPPYPEYAKHRGIQGTVIVEITIDPTGTPVFAEATTGPADLFTTAIRFALSWKFEPALFNGVPQWARFRLTMPFNLR